MFLLLGFRLVGQSPSAPCSTRDGPTIENRAKTESSQSRQDDVKAPQQKRSPCEASGTQPKSDDSAEAVGWYPMTDLDGRDSREIVDFFVLGLLVSAPIFLLVRRLRSRKNESEAARKVLE